MPEKLKSQQSSNRPTGAHVPECRLFNLLDYPLLLTQPTRETMHNTWLGHIPFAFMLMQLLRPRVVVELGAHQGSSYCALCQAVAELDLPTRCSAIDTWRGDDHAGRYDEEVLADLRAFHDPRYGKFSRLIQSTFDDALGQFDDGSIDLLHIDGLHTYEAVKHDFETWRPKVSARGVVLFHDTAERERDFGVWKLWAELRGTAPSFEFTHYHGLGVLALGNAQSPAMLELLRWANDAPDAARRLFELLGQRIDAVRVLHHLGNFLDQGQSFLDRWKRDAQLPVDDAPVNGHEEPLAAARRVARDLAALSAGDPRRNTQRQA